MQYSISDSMYQIPPLCPDCRYGNVGDGDGPPPPGRARPQAEIIDLPQPRERRNAIVGMDMLNRSAPSRPRAEIIDLPQPRERRNAIAGGIGMEYNPDDVRRFRERRASRAAREEARIIAEAELDVRPGSLNLSWAQRGREIERIMARNARRMGR